MKPPMMVIDGNSILHANHNSTPLTVGDFQVQAIFGFLRSLRLLLRDAASNTQVVVLWDGRAQWRMDIYPEYKGNRAAIDAKQQAHKDAFKRQTPFIEKALEMLAITQIRSPLLEADDIAGHLITGAAHNRKIKMISGDRDWIQLVHPNVGWIDPIRDRSVSFEDFFEKTGYYNPNAYRQGKALQGDNSDNVPGLPGMGEKGAALFLAKWESVERFFEQVDAGTHIPAVRKSKTAASLHPEQVLADPEGRALFARNMQLMDLLVARRPEKGELIINRGALNHEGFRALCQRLAFASILREFDAFLRDCNITPQQVPATA
jgi:5'-3' exonuclease